MQTKKKSKANLERWRVIFFQIGIVLALSILILAFEWNTTNESVASLGTLEQADMEEELVPITRPNEPPPPPPPPKPQVVEELLIVDNNKELDEQLKAMNNDIDINEAIPIVPLEPEDEEEDPVIFARAEEMPEFPGGERELIRWIARNVKYPAIARENDIQGRVFVRFVVTAQGKVDKVSIIRKVHPLLDNEAMRVVKAMPEWKPGRHRGTPVNVWYTVPISYKLQ